MILDSNIIIYSAETIYSFLLDFLSHKTCHASLISKIEVFGFIGFEKLNPEKRNKLIQFFSKLFILDINDSVINKAILLKQSKKMSLGDSIVAATALIHQLPLITRNTDDFKHIPNLQLINPFDQIKHE